MLRVGLDLSCLEAEPETGVERYARRLVEHLPKVAPGTEFVVFVRPGRPAPSVAAPARVVRVRSALPRAIWREVALPRALREHRIDVLHAPVAALSVRAQLRRVATIHDVPDFGAVGQEARLSRHRLRLLHCIKAADHLVVPSLATRDALLAFAPETRARLTVAPHGVDPDFRAFGASLDRARYGIPPGPFILSVGTIRERKDPLTLIEAFRKLVTVGGAPPDLHLVMCGDLRMSEDTLRAPLREAGLQDRLLLPGYFAREDLPDLYREATLFVVPSRLEGFGLSALEAMACGQAPVVSSDAALVELAGEAAAPFRTGDSADLARVLRHLLRDDAERKRLSERALARAKDFSWESSATTHARVYEHVMSAPPHGARGAQS